MSVDRLRSPATSEGYGKFVHRYPSIPFHVSEKFIDFCPFCAERVLRTKVTARPAPVFIREDEIFKRGQIDLIDMSTCPDGEFRYILNYIDVGASPALATCQNVLVRRHRVGHFQVASFASWRR